MRFHRRHDFADRREPGAGFVRGAGRGEGPHHGHQGHGQSEHGQSEPGQHEAGQHGPGPRGHGGDGHGGRGGGGHGHGGPGRAGVGRAGLGRLFAHGDLRLVILQLIAEKPRHGYEIIKSIEDLVGGAYSPSPGVVYPTLTLLEELGYVVVEASDGGRKQHTISPQGLAFLEANRPMLAALMARMAEASQVQGRGQAPQIVRALENLKLALRLRVAAGPLSVAQIDAIAAAIDAAAGTVEKV